MTKPRRDEAILLKLSAPEKKAIKEKSESENFSCVSDFVRKVLLDRVSYKNASGLEKRS